MVTGLGVFQVTIWVEKLTGQVVCTFTPRCPSDQGKVASETFSERTSSSTPATCATLTMVCGLKILLDTRSQGRLVEKAFMNSFTEVIRGPIREPALDIDMKQSQWWCDSVVCAGDGPRAHLQKLAECIRWSYGAGIVLRLGNIARLELNYCVPMGVQSGDR